MLANSFTVKRFKYWCSVAHFCTIRFIVAIVVVARGAVIIAIPVLVQPQPKECPNNDDGEYGRHRIEHQGEDIAAEGHTMEGLGRLLLLRDWRVTQTVPLECIAYTSKSLDYLAKSTRSGYVGDLVLGQELCMFSKYGREDIVF